MTEEIKIPETFDEVWKAIFEKQMKLALKYAEIEKMGDLLETTKDNLDTTKGQKWLKDFAWRVTEEITEAYEPFYEADKTKDDEKFTVLIEHFKEELSDALHFMVELSIIAGYDYKIVENVEGSVLHTENLNPWYTVYNLGLACNCLKNKAWKQSEMLTDRPKFESLLKETWRSLTTIMVFHMGSYKDIYLYYFKKNKVNQFRQKSKY